jgi:hypothetical protein
MALIGYARVSFHLINSAFVNRLTQLFASSSRQESG